MDVRLSMEIGDVVCLSEYGIARDFNKTITNVDPYQIGVITNIWLGNYPYRIHWMEASSMRSRFMVNSHSRRELKYAGR